MTVSKYIVRHFDLSRDLETIPGANAPALYCVFWYRSIPLGEAYLFPGEIATTEKFWQRVVSAIRPALQTYQSSEQEFPEIIPNAESIRHVCDLVLEVHEPGAQPLQCDISVIICSRNHTFGLEQCLERLQAQKCKPLEIIVVDNATPNDSTRKVAEQYQVRYIKEEKPGLDVARNVGARSARGSIVAYTDDDTLPDQYWLYRIAETFRDPAIAAMTGLVIAASLETEAEVIFEKFWPFNRGYLRKIFDDRFFRASLPSCPPVWEVGSGANMAFRKVIFEEVGYFDERLDAGAAGFSGDSEMWYRTLACGFSVCYNPLAVVHHLHTDSKANLKKQLYSCRRGFTVAMLIQYQRFGHRGNLQYLLKTIGEYLSSLKKGFPLYTSHKTLFPELRGILAGFVYYLRNRNKDSRIYSNDLF